MKEFGGQAYIWGGAVILWLSLAATHGAPSQNLVVTPAPVPEENNDVTSVNRVTSEDATEGPLLPLEVSAMNVKSDITLRYAHTSVVTAMKNPAHKAQEATFSIILPETAFITGFTMTLDGKSYTAYVKEKEEAKNIYREAVNSGQAAAHIATKTRDSNHFTVSVNIEPTTKAIFNLTYEELLTRRLDVYNHVINLNPGRVIPQLNVEVNIKEGRKIRTLKVPKLRTGNDITSLNDDEQNELAVIEKNEDETEAKITFSPNSSQQATLMQVYKELSKAPGKFNSHQYPGFDIESSHNDGVLGQFVVEYDVERDPHSAEIMVNDGYFVHFFAPSDLKPLNKHVIFVLDTSGSMLGRPISQLRSAMETILGELKPGDYFNIVQFASDVKIFGWDEETVREFHEKPIPATPAAVQTAKDMVKLLEADGLTYIDGALQTALRLANAGVREQNSVSTTSQLEGNNTRVGESNQDPSKPEPIIIFLTDGQANVGVSSADQIISRVSELNVGSAKTAIFSLAFGGGADRDFLKKLSLRNAGFMRHIYEAADASSQLHHFYRQVASPLLSHVRYVYPANEIEEGTLSKSSFHTLYAGAEIVVAGKLSARDKGVDHGRPTGLFCGVSSKGQLNFNVPTTSNNVSPKPRYHNLERLWAFLTVRQLLDEKDSAAPALTTATGDDQKETPEKRALRLSLKYSFVTPLTSLVVVKPNATSAVDAESVDKINTVQSQVTGSIQYLRAPSRSSGYATYPMRRSRGHHSTQSMRGFFPTPMYYSAPRHSSFGWSFSPRTAITPQPEPSDSDEIMVPKPNVLEQYRLKHYSWMEPYVNATADVITLPFVNGTVTVALTKGQTEPFTTADPCVLSVSSVPGTSSVPGVCRYLPSCAAAKPVLTSLEQYETYFCSNAGYAGVCCPETAAVA